MDNKVKAIILRNEIENDHLLWVEACKKYSNLIDYSIVDLTKNNWLSEIQKQKANVLLTKPGPNTSLFKELYDERVYVLERVLGFKTFPSAEEVFIYENKRFFSYWLSANNISHPQTDIFYFLKEAIEFLKTTTYPIVGKSNIGASGTGVVILKNINEATEYVINTFSGKGVTKRVGPNLQKKGLIKRGFYYIKNPEKIKEKLGVYKSLADDRQKGFVIFQQFTPHEFEWRAVRIGNSFFAHKKLKMGEKASGSLLKNYDSPPLSLMDFVREVTEKHNLKSVAVDIFESNGNYLVNEIQCIFGQSDKYQMIVDGKIGRYIYVNNHWVFEEGDFNGHESYDLRVEWVIESNNKSI